MATSVYDVTCAYHVKALYVINPQRFKKCDRYGGHCMRNDKENCMHVSLLDFLEDKEVKW